MSICARCHRPLTREPVVVQGHGYGPTCAAKVGDLLTQLVRKGVTQRKPRKSRSDQQPELFGEVRS
jgi:hypothetical protein